jgi:hypothetical protein
MTTSSTKRAIGLVLALISGAGCALRSAPLHEQAQGDHKSYVLPVVEIVAMATKLPAS